MSILTLQFGEYANYVGSHYWNFQDEQAGPAYCNSAGERELSVSALYRTTEAGSTPNLLLFDASGSEGLHRAMRGSVGLASVYEALRLAGVGGGEEGAVASRLLLQPHPFLSRLDACEEAWEEEEEEEEENEEREELEEQEEVQLGGDAGHGVPGGGVQNAGVGMDLASVVHSWGDFCKAALNPKGLIGVGGRTSVGDTICAEGMGLRSGLARFDAFSDGCGLADEACLDRVRWALEASDSLGGIQAAVDIDSGWGGFSLDVLRFLKDECPKAPMLVLGVSQPRSRVVPQPSPSLPTGGTHRSSAQWGGEEAAQQQPSLYASRNRAQLGKINAALAFSSFGAGELDCNLLPLNLQAALERGRGAFPGLLVPAWSSPFQTAALLAAAWDCASAPFRRNARCGGGGDAGEFTCPAGGWAEGAGGSKGGTGDFRMVGGGGGSGSGGGGGGGGGGGSSSNVSGQRSSAAYSPLAALPTTLDMGDYLTFLRAGRGHTLRISSASLSLPFPHPSVSPAHLRSLCAALAPTSHCHPQVFTPLSHAFQRLSTAAAAAAAPSTPPSAIPFAHALVARGVGSALGPIGAPSAALGCAWDEWLVRDECREAGHAVIRTPLPLPITLPRLLPKWRYCSKGGVARAALQRLGVTAGDARAAASARVGGYATTPQAAALSHLAMQRRFVTPKGWGSLPPTVEAALLGAPAVLSLRDAQEGSASPFAVPVLAHVSTAPSLGGCLRELQGALRGRDAGVGARFGAETSGAGGGAHTASGEGCVSFADAEDALGGLADEYAVGGGR